MSSSGRLRWFLGITVVLAAVFVFVPRFPQDPDYHRFADQLFVCTERLEPFAVIHSANFQFDLYGSGEFSRMLAEQWGE